MPQTTVADRLAQLQKRIAAAAESCDRDPTQVRLIAVSKTKPVEAILAAHQAGQRAFGENYLQEALEKIQALAELPLEWHFIGRLQSNKTRPIASHFHWVHTLADLKHARRLDAQRPEGLPPLQVCIQVNISGEASKGGIPPDELPELAAEVAKLPRLHLRGLMTMPPKGSTEQEQRRIFSTLRRLLDELRAQGLALDQLSMGMSGDLETAICEGATMVRIGTALFGSRT